MSYILDALKKAESERNLGNVPHLHAQPAAEAPAPERAGPWRSGLLIAAVLLLVICMALLYWFPPWQKESVYTQTVTNAPVPTSGPPGFSTPAVMSSGPFVAPPAPRKPTPEKAPAVQSAAEAPSAARPEQPAAFEPLPEHIRKDLPALAINCYIYADKAADRSVLVNNKLLREGDQVSADLLLEKITPNGLILSFRGYRYRAAY